MAHCSSSHVRTLPFVTHNNAHNENLQDLLPPRKRLLLGLKHAMAIPSDISPMPSPPPESLHMKVQGDGQHSRPSPPHSPLLHSHTQTCFTCGDGDTVLHRVPYLAGSSGYHCSSCVLEMNKQMYCVLCCDVIDEDSPTTSSRESDLLTCCRCERRTHFHCALKLWSPSLEGVGLTLCKDCHMMRNGQCIDFNIPAQEPAGAQRFKEPLVSAGKVKLPFVEAKELVAARTVALTAKRAALKAKHKAKFLAKAAAVAAVHAKATLECMYDLGQKEADVPEHGNSKHEVTIAANRNLKGPKRRDLSSIVASEMSSKRDGHMVNHMGAPDYLENEQGGMSSDSESAEAAPFRVVGMEAGPCLTQRGRSAIKRRKSLSLLGGQNSTNLLSIRNCAKIASKKVRKPRFLSKGNLGAIMSQVFASNELSMSTVKTP